MSKIKLITFDATNTLFRVHGSVGELYAQAASIHGVNADPENLETKFRKSFHHFNTNYPNFGKTVGRTSRQWWDDTVKGAFAGNHIKPVILANICKDLYDNFKRSQNWDIFPDVVPVLKELKENGVKLNLVPRALSPLPAALRPWERGWVKLGVISNFDERLPVILDELDLRQFFSFVVTSRETAFYKPSPQIFNYALSLAKCNPKVATHVGDNFNLDYKAARNAGMSAFLLLRQPTDTKMKQLVEENVTEGNIIHNLHMLCNKVLEK